MRLGNSVKSGASIAIIAMLACGWIIKPASAQSVSSTSPRFVSTDGNGVDLVDGSFNFSLDEGSIGSGDAKLSMVRTFGVSGWQDAYGTVLFRTTVAGQVQVSINDGSVAVTFNKVSGTFVPVNADGSSLTEISGGNAYTYTKANGDTLSFPARTTTPGPSNPTNTVCNASVTTTCYLPVGSFTKPTGLTINITWNLPEYCQGSGGVVVNCAEPSRPITSITRGRRVSQVANNVGYAIFFTYVTNSFQPGTANLVNWYRRSTATFKNTGVTGSSWPTITYAYPTTTTTTTSDIGGRIWTFTYVGDNQTGVLSGIQRPGASSNNIALSYSGGAISSITRDGVTTGYSRSVSGTTATTTVTNAYSGVLTAVADLNLSRVTQITDELNRTTNFAYDTSARPTRLTKPEGNFTTVAYDARGNVTSVTNSAKPGSGLAGIVTTANFDVTCSNAVTCNKPNWTKDALGNETDYTYDPTYGVVTAVTAPAAPNGVRPQSRYSYAPTSGVQLLTGISTCRTTSSCAGSADELKTTIAYNANILPTTATTSAGDGSLSQSNSVSYDNLGNVVTRTDPLSNVTTYALNANRQVVQVVGPDPDGAGPLLNRSTTIAYTADGLVSSVAVGTSNPDGSGFSALLQANAAYDANDRKATDSVVVGGATTRLTQYSYDNMGRISCAALRMNAAAFSSLPASACTLGVAGSFGNDRITLFNFDVASQLTSTVTGYGDTTQRTVAAYTYNPNGTTHSIADGRNNLTTTIYDGFDRAYQTQFPVATQGAGASNTSDYLQSNYDSYGRLASTRLRDGNSISYAYDALNRVTTKTLPSGESAVNYTYDNQNRPLTTIQGSATLTNGYDGLGRLISEGQPFGAITYQYDSANRMTRVTWPDALYVQYDHLTTGEISAIRENGATSGIGVLASYTYDNLGRLTGIARGNGVASTIGYNSSDATLQSIGHAISGAAVNFNFSNYSPAGQIGTRSRDNDAYAWTGATNVNRNYTTNGLNQYTLSGSVSLGYDARGNLNSSGGGAYTYSSENLLLAAPGGTGTATLGYDPANRLDSYSVGGSTIAFNYAGSQMASELTTSGALLRRYVWGPGSDIPVVWYEGAGVGDRRWLHADERGSVIGVTNASGGLIAADSYDEYGIPGSGNIGRFQYTGQALFPEIGLYYYKARFYSPTLGRFMQTDPAGYGDGPNWYNYAHADPINQTDPLGLEADDPRKTHPKLDGGGLIWEFDKAAGAGYYATGELLGIADGNGSGGGGHYVDTTLPGTPTSVASDGTVVVNGSYTYSTYYPGSFSTQNQPQSDDVVVTARRQQVAFHIYRINLLSPCRASAVFGYFLGAGRSAPGAPAAVNGTRTLMLQGGNPISQYVNMADMTIVNTTLPGHIFYPGSVKIQVTPLSAQTSRISITGTGDGSDAELNDAIGQGFFGGQAIGAQTVCM